MKFIADNHYLILYKYIKNFTATFIIGVLFNILQQPTHTFVCSLLVPFACHGNAGTHNVYNKCRTNAVAEVLYDDCKWSLAHWCVTPQPTIWQPNSLGNSGL